VTSIERLIVGGLMALSAGAGATSAVYLRPLQPPSQTATALPAQPRAVRTVSWFKAHQEEMLRQNSACADNPGMGANDPECVNASDAAASASFDRQIEQAKKAGIMK
jgi:hypothetical protein